MSISKGFEAFVLDPSGGHVSGLRWLVCAACPGLMALVLWEIPSREDVEQVVGTFRADLALEPHAYFIDARRMGPLPDPDAFAAVVENVAPYWQQYRSHINRCAVVLPPGMAAAVVVGFFDMAPPPFDTHFFSNPVEALEWAEAPDPPRLLASLDALQQEAARSSPLLLRLRALLSQDLASANIAQTARRLQLSTRSLQRRLVDGGTSFRRELNAARLRRAQQLLAGTDLKITAVALEVGCASSQHLSALFRKLTGESPSAFRTGLRRH